MQPSLVKHNKKNIATLLNQRRALGKREGILMGKTGIIMEAYLLVLN